MRACLLVVLVVVTRAPAAEVSDRFTRTGQSESLTARLDDFGGATTSGSWSGLVEIAVEGFGSSAPGTLTDAFYALDRNDPGIMLPGDIQGLRLSFDGCAASFECGAPLVNDLIVFVDGVGPVQPPFRPPFSPEHAYRFVIDVGETPRPLTLGEGDGGVFDNWGVFEIDLFSVAEDCDQDGRPDADQPLEDCDGNGVFDSCDLLDGRLTDSSGNGVPDACSAAFRRGDANADGRLDVSDAVYVLVVLFVQASGSECLDSLDADDSGAVDLADVTGLLAHLFSHGFPPARPRECGADPTADGLDCEVHGPCG